MEIASVALAGLGIIATISLGLFIHKKTTKLLKRINAIQVARSTPEELRNLKRLIEDWERTEVKRGTLAQTWNGKWKIDWTPFEETILL